MKCPDCGVTNPPDAIRCECGYEFKRNAETGSVYVREKGFSLTALAVFILIGVLIIVSFIGITYLDSMDKKLSAINAMMTEKFVLSKIQK